MLKTILTGLVLLIMLQSNAQEKNNKSAEGNIALIAINPFSRYVNQKTELFGPNFKTKSTRQVPFRSISLNFTFKFGKLEFKKEKEENKDVTPVLPEGQ
jgi:hypothetical protein